MILQEILKTKSVRFMNIINYTTNQKEISDYLININFSYSAAKQRDIHYLRSKEIRKFNKGAVVEILTQLLHPDSVLSQAQKDAYQIITPAIKIHKKTGHVMVVGMRIKKTIKVPGIYPDKDLSQSELNKIEIRKYLKSVKYRNFRLDKIKEVRVNGKILEVTI